MSKLETKDDVANWVLINLKRCKKEVQVVAVAKILQGFDRDQINQALSMSGVIDSACSCDNEIEFMLCKRKCDNKPKIIQS